MVNIVNKSVAGRRKSTSALPSSPISISIGICRRSSTETNANSELNGTGEKLDVNMRHRPIQCSRVSLGAHRKSDAFDRMYIKEGRILLYDDSNIRERYLFLFSDLLLVAKEKAINSYRLKERIRLSDVWIDMEHVNEIGDGIRAVERSFVIGWPIKNYVAEFSTVEEKDSWYKILRSQIHSEKMKERPKRTTISVRYKMDKKFSTTELTIDNFQTASEIARLSALKFGLLHEKSDKLNNFSSKTLVDCRQSCPSNLNIINSVRDPTDEEATSLTYPAQQCPYQLYVQCGKDTTHVGLKGHECVFAILLFYVRDLIPNDSSDLDLSLIEDLASSNVRFKCSFYLKLTSREVCKRKPTKKIKRQSVGGAGHLVSNLKRKVMRQMSHESPISSTSSSPYPPAYSDPGRRPPGHLFGRTLSDLVAEARPFPPKPILDAMRLILRDGMFMEGIFRKPPNHRVFREIREKLDSGSVVDFDQVQPTVAASLLKEFLRLLPDSLLMSSEFPQWLILCDEFDSNAKLLRAKQLLARLPKANYEMLRHLMCLLYHVSANEFVNQMNSYNLSVCIAPSLLNNAFTHLIGDINGRKAADVVQFLIENATELFGKELLTLLGDLPEQPVLKPDSEDDYDSSAQRQTVTSSTDSLLLPSMTARSPSSSASPCSPGLYQSRDSGLSDDVVVAAASPTLPPPPATTMAPQSASSSLSDDVDSPLTLKHIKKLMAAAVAAPRATANKSASGDQNRPPSTTTRRRLDDSWSSSGFADVDDADDGQRRFYSRRRRDHFSESSAAAAPASHRRVVESSADSLYESLDSACSYDSTPPDTTHNVRRARHYPSKTAGVQMPPPSATPNATTTLIRSESGNHLISLASDADVVTSAEVTAAATSAVGGKCTVDRRHAFRQKTKPSPTQVRAAAELQQSPSSCRVEPMLESLTLLCYGDDGAPQRPARRKKTQAPSPPQALTPLDAKLRDANLLSNGAGVAVEAVANVFQAQPVLVRCNDNGSGEDSGSSGGEFNVVGKYSTPATQKSSLTSSAPLPSSKTLAASPVDPMLKKSLKSGNAKSSTIMSAATTEIFSLRQRRDFDALAAARARLLTPVNVSANVPADKVSACRLRNLPAALASSLMPAAVHDSSNTVTEASSDESTTPHVSRESSRAQELKNVAENLFNKTTSASPSSSTNLVASRAAADSLVTSSTTTSMTSSTSSSRMTATTFKSSASPPLTTVAAASLPTAMPLINRAAAEEISLIPPQPSRILSSSQTRGSNWIESSTNVQNKIRSPVDLPLLPRYNFNKKFTPPPPLLRQKAVDDDASAYDAKRATAVTRRWRRKTLGADEYYNLLSLQYTSPSAAVTTPSSKLSDDVASSSLSSLATTVRDRVKFFDQKRKSDVDDVTTTFVAVDPKRPSFDASSGMSQMLTLGVDAVDETPSAKTNCDAKHSLLRRALATVEKSYSKTSAAATAASPGFQSSRSYGGRSAASATTSSRPLSAHYGLCRSNGDVFASATPTAAVPSASSLAVASASSSAVASSSSIERRLLPTPPQLRTHTYNLINYKAPTINNSVTSSSCDDRLNRRIKNTHGEVSYV